MRRLATVMFLDMVGFSARMSRNEASAMAVVTELENLLREQVPAHGGRLVKFLGDGSMAVFQTAGAAAACSLKLQDVITGRNKLSPPGDRYRVRIGLHLGEVRESGGDVFGESVNIAARIQPLADPGGIALSETVHAQIRNQMAVRGTRIRGIRLKNISERVSVFFVPPEGAFYPAWYARRHRSGVLGGCAAAAVLVASLAGYATWLARRDVLLDGFETLADVYTYAGGGATMYLDSVQGVTGRATATTTDG